MKLGPLFTPLALLLSALLLSSVSGDCGSVCVRKECRDLSPVEQGNLIAAIKKLANTPSSIAGLSIWDSIAKIHQDYFLVIHNNPVFCVWHRKFNAYVEGLLQQAVPGTCLCYWDWTHDAANLGGSSFWDFAGGSAVDAQGHALPIPNGPFQNFECNYPSRHILTRGYRPSNLNMANYNEAFSAHLVSSSKSYSAFTSACEYSLHGALHMAIGGGMMDRASPCDGLMFFAHHAYLERLYTLWQLQYDSDFNEYDGQGSNGPVSASDTLPYFTDTHVADVLDPSKMCYVMQPPSYGANQPAPTSQVNPNSPSTATDGGATDTTNPTGEPTTETNNSLDAFFKMNGLNPSQIAAANNVTQQLMQGAQQLSQNGTVTPIGQTDDGTGLDQVLADRLGISLQSLTNSSNVDTVNGTNTTTTGTIAYHHTSGGSSNLVIRFATTTACGMSLVLLFSILLHL